MINLFKQFQRGRLCSLWIFLVFVSGILASCSNEIEGEVFEEDKLYNLEIPTYFPALAFDIDKIPITDKLSVYASLPFQFHEKKTLQGNSTISGIGDASLMGIYQILNSKITFHQLNGGFGVKIPIGKFDEKGILGVNPSFQLGTGSWDYQLALNYKFQKNLFALLINTDYTIKTENKKHYQFGNQWNYAVTGFQRIWRNENSIFSGKLGLQGEIYDWNKQFGEVMPRTAGSALYGKIGFEASYKKWSIGSEVMLPAYTNLASGDIEAKSRFGLFVNFGI